MKTKNKTTKELRRFGLVMSVPLAILGCIFIIKGQFWGPYVLIFAFLFLITGLLLPRMLRPVEFLWMKIAKILSAIMTRIILVMTFYLIFTPMGILLKLIGKDLLKKDFNSKSTTYWEPVEENGPCSRPDKPY